MSATLHRPSESRAAEKLVLQINTLSDRLFDLYDRLQQWKEQKAELNVSYADYANESPEKKAGWLFLLCILVPALGVFDYSTISQFIAFLSASSGGAIGNIISYTGWLFFVIMELAIGWALIVSKGKPGMRILAVLLAIAVILVPPFLIFSGYLITPQKTSLLEHKTIALIVVSFLIHLLFFAVIGHVWNAINYAIYGCKAKALNSRSPIKAMRATRAKLLKLLFGFDLYVFVHGVTAYGALLTNQAWYLKRKRNQGSRETAFNFSSYNPLASYSLMGNGQQHPFSSVAPTTSTASPVNQ